jgi:hypothetical protein
MIFLKVATTRANNATSLYIDQSINSTLIVAGLALMMKLLMLSDEKLTQMEAARKYFVPTVTAILGMFLKERD